VLYEVENPKSEENFIDKPDEEQHYRTVKYKFGPMFF